MPRQDLLDRFVSVLKDLGGSAGNGRLREALGWAEDTYESVRAALLSDGVIERDRGRGGSVSLKGFRSSIADTMDGLLAGLDLGDLAPPPRQPPPAPAPAPAPVARAEPAKRGRAKAANAGGNGAALGFEAQLFLAADKLRKNLEPSDYKHVCLGLIFLRHISHAFEARHAALLAEDPAAAEDPDEYLAERVFWVPKAARWSHLQANAKQPTIGRLIDDAMAAIEDANPASLQGALPKDYNRPALDKVMLGELIDLVSGIPIEVAA